MTTNVLEQLPEHRLAESSNAPMPPSLEPGEVDVVAEYDQLVCEAREHLEYLLSRNPYIPTPVKGEGLGTYVAARLRYPFQTNRQQLFISRHNRDVFLFLRRFMTDPERKQIGELLDGPDQQGVRRRLMHFHREMIVMYQMILLGYSVTEDFDDRHIPGIDD